MIAPRLSRMRPFERIGGVQPLSSIVPALLRRYGIQFPPEARVSERTPWGPGGADGSLCVPGDTRSAVCGCGDHGRAGSARLA